ncbi:uncharacterized protein LOC135389605 [Ornithodoros turicata]|uniref:uncharacterized protein LOC135389605 n=1 Tax=Ornithodoros turicata TaxID=34597 RepID=UPI003139973B
MSAKEIKELVKAIEDLKREMRADNRSLKDSIQNCHDTLNECKNDIKELNALRCEVNDLKTQIAELKKCVQRTQQELSALEQYQRINNLEIKGVPKDAPGPADVVKKIAEISGVKLENADIDICHRVPTRQSDQENIIVRMISRTKWNELLHKGRKQKLTGASLGLSGAAKIFINEHLSPSNKQLMGAAVARKKITNWKHLWTNKGKIYARKSDDSPVLQIKTKEDINFMS